MINSYQLLARTHKCDRIVAVLREQKITAANVREVGINAEEFWAAAAFAAKVRPPSWIEKQMVVDELQKEPW